MKVDQVTGCVLFEELNLAVDQNTARSAFLQTPAGKMASIHVRNEPWCSFSLPVFEVMQVPFYATLWFDGGELSRISLMDGSAEFGLSWREWSEEKEHRRQ